MNRMMDRRTTLKLIGGFGLAALPGFWKAGNAAAGISWCRNDPHVVINGIELNVYPERIEGEPNACIGAIRMNFYVPVNASCAVLASDQGFGHGYDIDFIPTANYRGNQYRLEMYVPASNSSMSVRLNCDPVDPKTKSSIKSGKANSWISVITKI